METSNFAAWSNGQWIHLDLARNRYLGGVLRADAALQAAQVATVAQLRVQACTSQALLPEAAMLVHYLRCSWTARRARHLPIRAQLEVMRAAPLPETARQKDLSDIARCAWMYQHMRNLRFRRPACLEDSMCCALFLRRYIEAPSFHIGVKQPPFMAHAWVQVGDVLVNDTKNAVESFSEILRLEL